MTDSPFFWLGINFLCIVLQGFYSMMEMACVSFNRVRLQYYLTKDHKKARYINFLIRRPYRLFGTVMLGVNIALQVGSESSRNCYKALGFSPDYAPFTQIFLVVIFAELLPLTISRKVPERLALWGAPILYYSHYVFYPLIQFIGSLTEGVYYLLKIKKEKLNSTLSRDEFQKALETHHEEQDFNVIATNIFSLSATSAEQVCLPLDQVTMLPSTANVKDLRRKIKNTDMEFIPVYHKVRKNVIGIALPKDFVNKRPDDALIHNLHSPWFITAKSKLIRILKEFRDNRSSVAVVLNSSGEPMGILSLSAIFNILFNTTNIAQLKPKTVSVIERTFPGNTPLEDLQKELGIELTRYGVETLAQLVLQLLDTPAEIGTSVITDNLLLEVKEVSLYGIKSVSIKNLLS
ncbi:MULTISPECIES: CNNM domain-containing protein [Chlamydia]|uniref:Transporter associated domain protein n=2 Tax=Chlamydia TaxID=810 RepID=A0ABN0MNK5_CHLPS|nr:MULTISPECIES: hemolysin family protein [Chlamydia]AFS19433.1 CBS domain pair family protein [Chlamydia psittaci 84/55]AFS22626.1 CBS domain pair family protein [Chlamydia psittaci VS225]EPJ15488.1 transporter associated domain protein [Chlamydia psittaci 02DC18]EPJ16873.1 transporter associated domain protein [Chlamydia psittaci 02DC22]EPJ20092.1 transporter associated domain protein [Chlamydia psittaci 02DC21]EPJ21185.1 transporter associated domain protein [Chlamydia psittaci 02DC23]EPJ